MTNKCTMYEDKTFSYDECSKHGRDVLFVRNFSLKTGPPGKPRG